VYELSNSIYVIAEPCLEAVIDCSNEMNISSLLNNCGLFSRMVCIHV